MATNNNLKTATERTAWNGTLSTWAAVLIAWAATRLGVDIDASSPAFIAAVTFATPIFIGVFYRASREIAARWPALGRILFGAASAPSYGNPVEDG